MSYEFVLNSFFFLLLVRHADPTPCIHTVLKKYKIQFIIFGHCGKYIMKSIFGGRILEIKLHAHV